MSKVVKRLINQTDIDLCSDMLATENMSHQPMTRQFEFRDINIRNALNHIQKKNNSMVKNSLNICNPKADIMFKLLHSFPPCITSNLEVFYY